MKTYGFSKRSMMRRRGVSDKLILISDLALELSPIDFGIPEHGGLRTRMEQFKLYKAKLSYCDGFIHQSKHQSGWALDFYAYVDHAASWDKEHLAIVAAAFLQAAINLGIKIVWGGLWPSFPDYPHIQLAHGEKS